MTGLQGVVAGVSFLQVAGEEVDAGLHVRGVHHLVGGVDVAVGMESVIEGMPPWRRWTPPASVPPWGSISIWCEIPSRWAIVRKCSTSLGWQIREESMIFIAAPLPRPVMVFSLPPPGTSIAIVISKATTTVGSKAEPLAVAPLKPTSSWEVATAWIVAS